MIDVQNLTKHYGDRVAVDDLNFTVKPGIVTGFLGPNGAGKSTTMRLILGLDRPTAGSATVNGRRIGIWRSAARGRRASGGASDPHWAERLQPSALAQAQTHGISRKRVDEVIELVGLESVATKRVGGFSLGMGQRLGVAAALLGDPATLILDEPSNGLDPEGIRWIRNLLKGLAAEGRTVFVSSHLMNEMALTAERLVVVGRGRLIADTTRRASLSESASSEAAVRVRSSDDARARGGARRRGRAGASPRRRCAGRLSVRAARRSEISRSSKDIAVYELGVQEVSLEDAFMRITRDVTEYQGDRGTPAGRGSGGPGMSVVGVAPGATSGWSLERSRRRG